MTALILSAGAITAETYTLTSGGRVIGEAEVAVSPRGAGFSVRTEAVSTEGGIERTIREQATVGGDWLPTDYNFSIAEPSGETRATVSFDQSGATIKMRVGMAQEELKAESTTPLSPWLEDITFAGAVMLLHRANLKNPGTRAEYAVLLPLDASESRVSLEAVEMDGELLKVRGRRSGGWSFDALWNPETKTVLQFEVAGNFEAEIKHVGIGEVAERPQGYNPLSKANIDDRDLMRRVGNIKTFRANMAFNFGQADAERLFLNHYSQEFAGEITESRVMGEVEVKNLAYKVTNSPEWPLIYPLRGYDEIYSMPERGIDSDDPQIKARAERIIEPAKTMWDAARAINIWVNRNIQYDAVSGGAGETFKIQRGDSRAKALLCAAMCRSVGIPARIVSGVLWADGPMDHTWLEVYLGEKAEWGPMDPTLDEGGRLSAGHISIWLGTEYPPVMAKDIFFESERIE